MESYEPRLQLKFIFYDAKSQASLCSFFNRGKSPALFAV
jgi:hypothetical protein